jgi:hypothetical protein
LEDLGGIPAFFEDESLRFIDLAVAACLTFLGGMSGAVEEGTVKKVTVEVGTVKEGTEPDGESVRR